jgi:trypsin
MSLVYIIFLVSIVYVCSVRPITRIIGGTIVESNDRSFNFIVSLQANHKVHFCGGSLIHPNWVLTAAHCVDNNTTIAKIVYNTYQYTNNTNTAAADRVVIHKSFRSVLGGFDIALIKLKTPINNTKPAVLNNCPGAEPYEQVDKNVTVAGWGNKEDSLHSADLLQVSVPIISSKKCSFYLLSPSQMCAGDWEKGGRDSCQGDSGGPLVYKKGTDVTLVGIVSYGNGCARKYYPGVYTRISSYVQWIKNEIGVDYKQLKLQYTSKCPKRRKS